MSEKQILTDDLLKNIVESRDPDTFLDNTSACSLSLAAYLNALLEQYGKKKSEVIRASRINETFGYQLFSGARKNPSRNKVLALALAMGCDVRDVRRLLCVADAGDLYVKNRRDAIIVFCISHEYGLDRTDEELHRFGEETISDAGNG